MAAGNLRPHIQWMRSAQRERPLSSRKIYNAVAQTGVAGFDPRAKRDRNLLNRELSDLAGMSPEFHSKPTLTAWSAWAGAVTSPGSRSCPWTWALARGSWED